MEQKIQKKENKQQVILQAAEALILEKGLDKLNMDEVAERADVSKGTLYVYFKNKTELVLGICTKASDLLTHSISQVLTRDISGLEMIYEIGRNFLNFVSTHPEYYSAMRFFDSLREMEELHDSVFANHCYANKETAFTYMVRAIQIGMQDGSVNPGYAPKELALLLWATSHGMINMIYLHQTKPNFKLIENHQFDIEKLMESYMKLMGCGMATNQ